ncbi:zinc ribbon domain-containing protein [Terrimonas ferruginea]|uniref:zinc ribbon domain-containing protein n=1 Tax=Terrimonas ferruginea TaxID=249 RepID=UPI000490AC08|nr:zinc ribbon domain-containing protein [Terrimonas ferruginea]
MKRFIKCDECGAFLRAYKAWKNQQYYYKCNTRGCSCNRRADEVHKKFFVLLGQQQLNVNEDVAKLISAQMIATYNQLTKEKQRDSERLNKQLQECEKKIERLEERYINEEIDRDLSGVISKSL